MWLCRVELVLYSFYGNLRLLENVPEEKEETSNLSKTVNSNHTACLDSMDGSERPYLCLGEVSKTLWPSAYFRKGYSERTCPSSYVSGHICVLIPSIDYQHPGSLMGRIIYWFDRGNRVL